jgi:hypothetical protein
MDKFINFTESIFSYVAISINFLSSKSLCSIFRKNVYSDV